MSDAEARSARRVVWQLGHQSGKPAERLPFGTNTHLHPIPSDGARAQPFGATAIGPMQIAGSPAFAENRSRRISLSVNVSHKATRRQRSLILQAARLGPGTRAPVDQRIEVGALGKHRVHRRVRIAGDIDSFESFDAGELPRGQAKDEPRVLDREEIASLLDAAAARYVPLLATGVFAGPRAMELLGLCWRNVDLGEGVLRIRHQLTRGTRVDPARLVELKTRGSRRDVVLFRNGRTASRPPSGSVPHWTRSRR